MLVQKPMSVIVLNLVDNQLMHIKSYKRAVEAGNVICNIHKKRSLSNIFFIHLKFFMYKMQESGDLLDHVNKMKAFVY
jgi:hypothetical protein